MTRAQRLGFREITALVLVSLASLGVTLGNREPVGATSVD